MRIHESYGVIYHIRSIKIHITSNPKVRFASARKRGPQALPLQPQPRTRCSAWNLFQPTAPIITTATMPSAALLRLPAWVRSAVRRANERRLRLWRRIRWEAGRRRKSGCTQTLCSKPPRISLRWNHRQQASTFNRKSATFILGLSEGTFVSSVNRYPCEFLCLSVCVRVCARAALPARLCLFLSLTPCRHLFQN